jgi:hypothetical protein
MAFLKRRNPPPRPRAAFLEFHPHFRFKETAMFLFIPRSACTL